MVRLGQLSGHSVSEEASKFGENGSGVNEGECSMDLAEAKGSINVNFPSSNIMETRGGDGAGASRTTLRWKRGPRGQK